MSATYRFEIHKSTNNQFYFRFRAPNNEVIVVSETYTTKQSCQHAIGLLKTQAANAPVYDYAAAAA